MPDKNSDIYGDPRVNQLTLVQDRLYGMEGYKITPYDEPGKTYLKIDVRLEEPDLEGLLRGNLSAKDVKTLLADGVGALQKEQQALVTKIFEDHGFTVKTGQLYDDRTTINKAAGFEVMVDVTDKNAEAEAKKIGKVFGSKISMLDARSYGDETSKLAVDNRPSYEELEAAEKAQVIRERQLKIAQANEQAKEMQDFSHHLAPTPVVDNTLVKLPPIQKGR